MANTIFRDVRSHPQDSNGPNLHSILVFRLWLPLIIVLEVSKILITVLTVPISIILGYADRAKFE